MSQIENLTEAQRVKFKYYVEKWTKIGLSTDPANRSEAENGIKKAYQIAEKKPPKIVWCGSPFSQGLTRAIIFRSKDSEIQLGKSLKVSVWNSVRDSVGASVRDIVGASVGDSVRDSVWNSVWASVGASVRDSVRDSVYGQQEASWLAFYEYFKEICGLDSQTQKLSGIWQISKNAGWWLPHENLCWISERPNILHRDTQGRLHKDGDFALRYPDGWGIYAWHGVRLPRQYGSIRSERWQSEWLLKETNAELRRTLIQGIGYSRLCKELQAESLDSWREYELLKLGKTIDVEPVVMIKMTCPSTGLIHAHRVPQEIKTAREAISWVNQEIDPEEFVIER